MANDNDRQLVVVAYVALFGVAQLVYGPLADAFGRRSVLIYALGIYIAGSVLCVIAPNFELFLAARALQGVGAAATRVIATAVVRDLTEGRRMAQVMSMAMTVFMIVPIIAPGIGQLILFVAPWRWIFGALLIYALHRAGLDAHPPAGDAEAGAPHPVQAARHRGELPAPCCASGRRSAT